MVPRRSWGSTGVSGSDLSLRPMTIGPFAEPDRPRRPCDGRGPAAERRICPSFATSRAGSPWAASQRLAARHHDRGRRLRHSRAHTSPRRPTRCATARRPAGRSAGRRCDGAVTPAAPCATAERSCSTSQWRRRSIAITSPLAVGGSRAVLGDQDPPATLGGARPAVAMSPPRLTQGARDRTRRLERGDGGKIGGEAFAGRPEVELDPARHPRRAGSARSSRSRANRARARRARRSVRAVGEPAKSPLYPSMRIARADRRIHRPVRPARSLERPPEGHARQRREVRTRYSAPALTRRSSESGRNRL